MNSDLVLQAARASLTGSLPFPEIVRNLIQAGVEYYHVDYILLQFTFYGTNAASVVAPLTFEGLPAPRMATPRQAPPPLLSAPRRSRPCRP